MKDSYRGGLRNNNASYVNNNGFKGQNRGILANAVIAGKTIDELYKSIPAYYRLHLFNDEGAWREDQNSEVPTMDDYGNYRLQRMNEGEWKCPECGEIVSGDVCPKCGYKRTGEEAKTDYDNASYTIRDASYGQGRGDGSKYDGNAENEWTADKMATAQHEEMGAQDPDNWTAKNGYKRSFEAKDVNPDESLQFDGKDNIVEWQKYLNSQGYKLAEDGIWGKKSQSAYDDWQSKQ